ncbi:AIM24 family protein [Pasteuria penetrans]|uniref:AIM24 family protein n=1 Tax=Pasteuria penetrans TaxID=86005 RepID=UPI0011EFDE8D|nr:AIM24 family protein [Pasteuria penetrans]
MDMGMPGSDTSSVDYDVWYVGIIKSALLGGEGIFLAILRGPGCVRVQSLPFARWRYVVR